MQQNTQPNATCLSTDRHDLRIYIHYACTDTFEMMKYSMLMPSAGQEKWHVRPFAFRLSLLQRFQYRGETKNRRLGANCYIPG